MKTKYLFGHKNSLYFVLGIFAILATSCGTYQNTSYYDRDGIYGSSESQNNTTSNPQYYSDNSHYKDYFGSLQNKPQQDEIFTDVDSYSTNDYNNNDNSNSNQEYSASYSDWGNSADNININLYGGNWGWSNYWGWNLGWGWNSWYGPAYYGWGYNPWYAPYYGWSFGWNPYINNYYYGGHNHYQPYYGGTRYYSTGRGRSYATNTSGIRNPGNNSGGGRYNSNSTIRTGNSGGIRTNNGNLNTSYSTMRSPGNSTIRNSANIGRNPNSQGGYIYTPSNTSRSGNTSRAPQSNPTRSGSYSMPTRSSGSYSSPSYSSGGGSSSGRSSGRR